jgi:hypothetical protein
MNKRTIPIFILGFMIITAPFLVYAKGLVPDCGTITKEMQTINGKQVEVSVIKDQNQCNFESLMKLINNVITFLLITMATPLFALILIYVGWLFLSDRGSSSNVTKAKTILFNALIGYVIALAAWLIVHTILSSFGFTGTSLLAG